MNCPRCTTAHMTELDRDGVTIDRCDRCRGIWLDRGELEKLIARAGADDEHRHGKVDRRARLRDDDDEDDEDDDRRRGSRRRGAWWDLFD